MENHFSSSIVPFFDIDLENIAKIFLPHEKSENLFVTFKTNIEIFEDVFGFDFKDQPLLRTITNHSMENIENKFPELKLKRDSFDELQLKLINSKHRKLLTNESLIFKEFHAKLVY